jgi:excisionase family DNA binding protein
MTNDKPKKIIRVSVSEAARLLGLTSHTIRRAIKAEEITYVVVHGRYKINFESLIRWSQQKIRIKNKMEKDGIGQFVGQWKIKNKLFSPNPESIKNGKGVKDIKS